MTIPVGSVACDDSHVIIARSQRVSFGRSPENPVRIGHQPAYDELVPRQAGEIFFANGRLVVANTSERFAFDARVEDRPPISIPPGSWFSPTDPSYEVHVRGAVLYTITVNRNQNSVNTIMVELDEPIRTGPPTGATLELTARQRAVLNAYVEPLSKGAGPATHQQVADRLHISRSLVRVECNKIWSALLFAGVPMRNFEDTRDQIVDAWNRHRF
jgi:hypothetical protein